MIRPILRTLLPPHLDWIADVAGDVVELVEDAADAHRDGWTDNDERELIDGIAEISRRLAHGIRNAVQAAPRRGRWVRQ